MSMTKTEAADILATDVLAYARQHDKPITKDLIELRMSEIAGSRGCPNHYEGSYKWHAVNAKPPWRNVLRLAQKWNR
ncbi:hypothetical protein [Mycobacteroides abscessus]|nr:hypothetical protein [Mycobacteroides abscessus]MBN7333080.1 hypothetical protein [Mycobacteroides abscessus subsp. abscessus]SKU93195.1 Uncharacterised protein [Mycobacteroides abscessus subsp. massiliense]SKV01657.1 Uncharacterised protein [Mycobacteroides abscessus subsp. massiliense]